MMEEKMSMEDALARLKTIKEKEEGAEILSIEKIAEGIGVNVKDLEDLKTKVMSATIMGEENIYKRLGRIFKARSEKNETTPAAAQVVFGSGVRGDSSFLDYEDHRSIKRFIEAGDQEKEQLIQKMEETELVSTEEDKESATRRMREEVERMKKKGTI